MKRHAGCSDVTRRLDDLVQSLLDETTTERLTTHVSACGRCDARLRRRGALLRSLTQPPAIELPSGFRDALTARLLAEETGEAATAPVAAPRWRPRLWDRLAEAWQGVRLAPSFRPVATFAAVCVVAVVLAYMAAQVVGTRRGTRGVAPVATAVRTAPVPQSAPAPEPTTETAPVPAQDAVSGVADATSRPRAGEAARPTLSPPPSALALTPVTPAAHEVVDANGIDVVAAFDGAAIDPARVVLLVDGENVTSGAQVTDDYVLYSPAALAAGRHVIDLTVRDASGARRDLRWEFYVLGS